MAGRHQVQGRAGQNAQIKFRYWIWSFIVVVLLLGFVFYYFSDIRKGLMMLKRVNILWLFVALIAQFTTYFFTAMVYASLLSAYHLKNHPRLWDIMKATIVLLFFNQAIPSAGVSGNTYFFRFLSRFRIPRAKRISLILIELLVFYAAMIVVIGFLLSASLFLYPSRGVFKATLAIGFAVYLIFGLAVILAGRKNIVNRLLEKAFNSKFVKWIYSVLKRRAPEGDFSRSDAHISEALKSKGKIFKAFLFHLLVISADSCTLYVLFLGLGYPVSPLVVLLTLVSTRIIAIIPFLPGALVLYESSMSFFFASAGVPLGIAIVVTMVYRILSFWLPIPIGTFLYRRWVGQKPALRKVSSA